jgi:AcrR family transcriptional regulator
MSVWEECTIWYMTGQAGDEETGGGPANRDQGAAAAPRQRLLDAVVTHFTEEGLADQSLRHIAEAIGTSHRMLLYHFGSKDGLLLAVVREVEARTQRRLLDLGEDVPGEPDAVIRRMWAYLADPALGDFERLFFALYGRALQGDGSIRTLLEDDVTHWLDANVALTAPWGVPADVARTHARLGLAVTRGLLLDLLATGDRAGVESALDLFAAGYSGRWWEAAAADDTP